MGSTSVEMGLNAQFTRGRCNSQIWAGDQWHSVTNITFHPNPNNNDLFAQLMTHPHMINRIDIVEVAGGANLFLRNDFVEGFANLPLPPAAMVGADEWRMWTNAPPLNEFGYLYVALFIAGNYARYYPDRWLSDVEKSTPLALAIEQLCTLAEWRVPWLSLCELEGVLFVNDV